MMKHIHILTLLLAVFIMSCGMDKEGENQPSARIDESSVLYDFFAQTGNYINSPGTPAIMTASEFIEIMDNQDILVIDLRPAIEFADGHIVNAINVQPDDVPDFFSQHIDAPSFERIIFLCNRGQMSSYVNGIMRLLGNNNTWSVRYGLSGLNTEMGQAWDQLIGNHPEATADTSNIPMPAKSSLPVLTTGENNGYKIAQNRARTLLAQESKEFFITFEEVMKKPSDYFIIAYVSPKHYTTSGHLPGAVRFTPMQSLSTEAYLLNVPADKPIVVYCFNGHHSAQAVAYLRMLGYNAHSLLYGANAFMHDFLKNNDAGTPRYWSDLQKNDIPFQSSQGSASGSIADPTTTVKKTAGGC